jgi:hypothetical protein
MHPVDGGFRAQLPLIQWLSVLLAREWLIPALDCRRVLNVPLRRALLSLVYRAAPVRIAVLFATGAV